MTAKMKFLMVIVPLLSMTVASPRAGPEETLAQGTVDGTAEADPEKSDPIILPGLDEEEEHRKNECREDSDCRPYFYCHYSYWLGE